MENISKEELENASKKAHELGKAIGTNTEKMEKTYNEAVSYFHKVHEILKIIGGEDAIKSLLSVGKAILEGKCAPSTKMIITVMGALAYFVLPMDIVPDFLVPILGFIDDYFVARIALEAVKSESIKCEEHIALVEKRKKKLEEYREFLNQIEQELEQIDKILNQKDKYEEFIRFMLKDKGGEL